MNRSLLGCDDVLGVWLPLCQSYLITFFFKDPAVHEKPCFLYCFILKMKTLRSSRMLENTHQTTQCHNALNGREFTTGPL